MEESNFKFLGYKVTKIDYEISDGFASQPDKINQQINIQNNFSKDDPRFVEVVLTVNVTNEAKSFKFLLVMKGGFKADTAMSDDIFTSVCQSNAPAILFPFARAIISNYTLQANIPPVLLPAINFQTNNLKEVKSKV